MRALSQTQKKLNETLRPPGYKLASRWADSSRYLSRESSAEAGKWKTSRAPFQREVLDAIFEEGIQVVVVKAATQLLKTETILNTIGYHIDQDPCPILVIQPTLSLARTFSKDRLATMIRDTPGLKHKVAAPKSRDSDNTILHKRFDGGHITIASSQSLSELAMRPIRILLCDEADKYPRSTDEGSPIELARKRTATFDDSKVFIVSSPTIRGESKVDYYYSLSDQRVYMLPCPFCGHSQSLIWSRIKWDKNSRGKVQYSSVGYECAHCKERIKEHYKSDMLLSGKWEKQSKSRKIAGFWINELYSPWKSWEELVESFIMTKNDPEGLKVFVNTSLAEVFEERGEAPSWEILFNRKKFYSKGRIPAGGLVLVAGADVQSDRIEVEIKAYGKSRQSWSVDYRILYGDPEGDGLWERLNNLLEEKFEHESGGKLQISLLAIDSGFATNSVYNFGRRHSVQRVMVVKGETKIHEYVGKPSVRDFDYRGMSIKRGVRLFPVNSNKIKRQIFLYLNTENEETAGYMFFPEGYPEDYYKQLTAETLIRRKDKYGFDRYEYKKVRDRNEVLDCTVYARAASIHLGVDYFTDLQWGYLKKKILESKTGSLYHERQSSSRVQVISEGIDV